MSHLLNVVPVDAIDRSDRFYKISRTAMNDRFRDSVREIGIVDPPLLLEEGGRLRIVFGFNRIAAAVSAGCREISARIADRLDPMEYAKECVVKALRSEIGPAGKCRALVILKTAPEAAALLRRWSAVPANIEDTVEAFPPALKDYLDERDVSFKTIRELAALGPRELGRIAAWASSCAISLNHFKQIAEMAVDIVKRDGSLNGVNEAAGDSMEDRRERGEALYRAIYRCRYPEYSALRERVAAIERELRRAGVELDFPRYFEGTGFSLALRVDKKDDPESAAARAGGVPAALIRELQDLL